MKVLLQWASNKPTDWQEVDSSAWTGLPKKKDPNGNESINGKPGWINRLCVQGVEFTADHYAVEDLPGSGCRVYAWSDDPEDYPDGFKNAKVCEFLYLSPDPKMGGAINTRQTITFYAESGVKALMPSKIVNGEVKDWADFPMPDESIIRHGVWLPYELYISHEELRAGADWREWTEGLDPRELDRTGKVKRQRSQGKYLVPSGTRTYYAGSEERLTGTHDLSYGGGGADNNERAFNVTLGGGALTSQALKGGDTIEVFAFTTASGEPDHAQWPSGNYRMQLDISSIGLDITYGMLNLGTAEGHFARVSQDLNTEHETKQQQESAFAGTGLKLGTTGNVTWASGDATDRFEVLVAAQRAANHGNQTISLDISVDCFADGPWEAAENLENSIFFGMNF